MLPIKDNPLHTRVLRAADASFYVRTFEVPAMVLPGTWLTVEMRLAVAGMR